MMNIKRRYGRSQMASGAVWEIPFGVLTPPNTEGVPQNVLAVCALSTSHVGFQPFRVEPTWMAVGQAAGTASALAAQQGVQPARLTADTLQHVLRSHGQVVTVADMPTNPVPAQCAQNKPPPPPSPPRAVSAAPCDGTALDRLQWALASDGTLRPVTKNLASNSPSTREPDNGGTLQAPPLPSHCLTALLGTPEPTSGHGVAVGLSVCASPPDQSQKWDVVASSATGLGARHAANSSQGHGSTMMKQGAKLSAVVTTTSAVRECVNDTLRTSVVPPPMCFGAYKNETCTLLTVLAWETTLEKTVMLWTPASDARDPRGHPQRWTYNEGTGNIVVEPPGAPPLCLAHAQ